jgi:phospholipid/cholesterol/gamma-HCH transport system substrate-binding protein
MDLTFNQMERIVGTFVIGITILLLSTVVIIGRGKNWFEKSVTYYTIFNEGYNLQTNTPVKLFKTDIGKVKQIILVENKVRVKLSVLQKYQTRIRMDSVAVVESPTFIGSEYVSIIPGSASAIPIPPEGEIPSRERKSIASILSEFQVEKTAKMVVQAVQDLADFAAVINNPKGPINITLENISKASGHIEHVTGDIQKGNGTLGSLVRTRELMDAVLARLGQVEIILEDVGKAAAKTPLAMDQVNSSLTTLDDTSKDINDMVVQIASVIVNIQKATKDLKIILDNMKQGSDDVPRITQTAKEGIREIREGVANINKVVKSLQKNILIRGNIPPNPELGEVPAGVRR